MPEIITKNELGMWPPNETWKAGIWLNREFFHARGSTEQEAVYNLKQHLLNIIPIYENNIQVAKAMIEDIREVTNG